MNDSTQLQIAATPHDHSSSGTNNSDDAPTDGQAKNPEQRNHDHHAVSPEEREFYKDMREGIMIVAVLAAGSTYQAGLNPPGSFWQDDSKGHRPGDPIMHDMFLHRYTTFFYFNAISFLSSLAIIIFLMNKKLLDDREKIKALQLTMVLDLFTFMAAYAVGSCRRVRTSLYIFLIMGVVFLYVLWLVSLYPLLRKLVRNCCETEFVVKCCKLMPEWLRPRKKIQPTTDGLAGGAPCAQSSAAVLINI